MECRAIINKIGNRISLVIETTNGLTVKLPLTKEMSEKKPAKIAQMFKGEFGLSEICDKINGVIVDSYNVMHLDDNFVFACGDIDANDHWEAVISAEVVGECLMSNFAGHYV